MGRDSRPGKLSQRRGLIAVQFRSGEAGVGETSNDERPSIGKQDRGEEESPDGPERLPPIFPGEIRLWLHCIWVRRWSGSR